MFDDIKIPPSRVGFVRSIPFLFRCAKYLFAENRPPEKETVENFVDLIRPAVDEAANTIGYSAEWRKPSIVITNSGEITLENTRMRQFFNIASQSAIDLAFQYKTDKDRKLSSTITIVNSIYGGECSYTSSTYGRKCRLSWVMPLDFSLSDPARSKFISSFAKVATILTLATENEYQALRQTQDYKKVSTIFDITP